MPANWRAHVTQSEVDLDGSEAKLFQALLAWKRAHPHCASARDAVSDPMFDYGTVVHLRQHQTHLDKAKRSQVAELYREGVAVNEIAERFGVHRKTVREIAKAAGLAPKPRGLLPDQLARAVVLYESGWSLARVGEEFSVDAWCVRKAIAQQGVVIRPRQGGRQRA